ncbi:GAF domain-containing protein, partial [Escherichia coli]|nr:GAF domain-containing protein [Escherichia coli]
SVTAVEGGSSSTVAFTGSLAASLDERQYQAGDGPCLHAATTGVVTTVAMADPPTRYAEFAAAARRHGVTHSLSVPLPVAESWVGALNLYTR